MSETKLPTEKILHMTLKKKWFDMIASGEKLEEYREIKMYWVRRLSGYDYGKLEKENYIPQLRQQLELAYSKRIKSVIPLFTHIVFKNGYAKDAAMLKVECLGVTIGTAKPEWSDNWQGNVFIIKLGKILTNSTI